MIWKDVLEPGTYHTLSGPVTFTRQDLRGFYERGKRMLAKGLQIPIPLAHQDTAKPFRPGDAIADKVRNNTGEVLDYRLDGDTLMAALNVADDDIRGKLGTTIKWVSPEIEPFRDGDGEEFGPVITHVALTPRPVHHRQRPFTAPASKPTAFADMVRGGAHLSFRLSLDDLEKPVDDTMTTDTADEEEVDTEEPEEKPADDAGSEPAIGEVIADLAATVNVHLPHNTTASNFIERLGLVLKHMKSSAGGGADDTADDAAPSPEGEDDGTQAVEEQPQGGYAMSHDKKPNLWRDEALRLSRLDMARRITNLYTSGRIGPDRQEKLKARLNTFQLSLDRTKKSVLEEIVEEFEALPPGASWAGKKAKLSHDEVVHEPPASYGEVDLKVVDMVAKRLAGKA